MAYLFDGTDDSIHWGVQTAVNDQTTLSCQAWVYNDNLTQDHYIISTADGSGNGISFLTDDVGSEFGDTNTYGIVIKDGGSGQQATINGPSSTALATTWQHVAFTFVTNSGTGLRLYVDGVESTRGPVATGASLNTDGSGINFTIGEAAGGFGDRAGRIAEVACWQRVLTAAEVTWLSRGYAPSTLPVGLVFYAPLRGIPHNIVGAGGAGTVTGAVVTAHPRIFAGGPRLVGPRAAAGGGGGGGGGGLTSVIGFGMMA